MVSKGGRALLSDFGASRVSIATRTGNTIGGAYWTSPELFLGEIGAATRQSDIWSYACTCYEVGCIPNTQPVLTRILVDLNGRTAVRCIHRKPGYAYDSFQGTPCSSNALSANDRKG